jgi:hypothetical protein
VTAPSPGVTRLDHSGRYVAAGDVSRLDRRCSIWEYDIADRRRVSLFCGKDKSKKRSQRPPNCRTCCEAVRHAVFG